MGVEHQDDLIEYLRKMVVALTASSIHDCLVLVHLDTNVQMVLIILFLFVHHRPLPRPVASVDDGIFPMLFSHAWHSTFQPSVDG